jgi:hypothetical protein
MPNPQIEIFDCEQESLGWTREITFSFKGKTGKMLLAWSAHEGYTNCELLRAPAFANEQDGDEFDGWFDSISSMDWDIASDKWIAEED